jgi:Zn finger protein HypA/HybF involved in hydrogenase expression
MSSLEQLKKKAASVDAKIYCPECPFEELFVEFLEREDRVTEATETVHFGCPACGSDTVDLGKETGQEPYIVVNGIEEMEQLAGE